MVHRLLANIVSLSLHNVLLLSIELINLQCINTSICCLLDSHTRARFPLTIFGVTGLILLVIGGILRLVSRRTLKKAGFTLFNSGRLQVVEGHQLITEGAYIYIRHPLYLGEIVRNLGFALLLNSLLGLIIMVVGNTFLLLRIRIEEAMLIGEFGQEYIEYRKRTKQLIPYIF